MTLKIDFCLKKPLSPTCVNMLYAQQKTSLLLDIKIVADAFFLNLSKAVDLVSHRRLRAKIKALFISYILFRRSLFF